MQTPHTTPLISFKTATGDACILSGEEQFNQMVYCFKPTPTANAAEIICSPSTYTRDDLAKHNDISPEMDTALQAIGVDQPLGLYTIDLNGTEDQYCGTGGNAVVMQRGEQVELGVLLNHTATHSRMLDTLVWSDVPKDTAVTEERDVDGDGDKEDVITITTHVRVPFCGAATAVEKATMSEVVTTTTTWAIHHQPRASSWACHPPLYKRVNRLLTGV